MAADEAQGHPHHRYPGQQCRGSGPELEEAEGHDIRGEPASFGKAPQVKAVMILIDFISKSQQHFQRF